MMSYHIYPLRLLAPNGGVDESISLPKISGKPLYKICTSVAFPEATGSLNYDVG
jgi:hypothetical protein